MTRLFACLSIVASVAGAQVAPPADARDSLAQSLVRDLAYLAGEPLLGRAAGTPGADSAAVYLARRYRAMQVAPAAPLPVCDADGACGATYIQSFLATLLSKRGLPEGQQVRAFNVVAAIPGTDSALAGQWIVLGAHYDHLGQSGVGSMDKDFPTRPHLGADDNASGTVSVLALARRIADAPLRRPVLIVHFGAEELGLVGSQFFVSSTPVQADSIVAMFNFDMVGRLHSGSLELLGAESSRDWHGILAKANEGKRFHLVETHLEGGDSDHSPFARVGVPVLAFFTGMHPQYHTSRDTMDRLDIEGIVRIVEFAELVIRTVGDSDTALSRQPRR